VVGSDPAAQLSHQILRIAWRQITWQCTKQVELVAF